MFAVALVIHIHTCSKDAGAIVKLKVLFEKSLRCAPNQCKAMRVQMVMYQFLISSTACMLTVSLVDSSMLGFGNIHCYKNESQSKMKTRMANSVALDNTDRYVDLQFAPVSDLVYSAERAKLRDTLTV